MSCLHGNNEIINLQSVPRRDTRKERFRMKTTKIAVSNQKGGVGKTTTVMNLGAALSAKGRKVLLVDLDPQHHLSTWLGFEQDGMPTSTDLIYSAVANLPANYQDAIRTSKVEHLDYIPANKLLAGMLGILATDTDSANVLTRVFNDSFFKKYDYIIFDCQTALDLLVTNVLRCCDKLLIPVQADLLAYGGVEQMIETFMKVKNDPDIKKYLLGMLVTMYVSTTTHSREVYEALKRSYGELVFDTYISFRTEAKNAIGYHVSSVSNSKSAVGAQYIEIANKVMEVCENG